VCGLQCGKVGINAFVRIAGRDVFIPPVSETNEHLFGIGGYCNFAGVKRFGYDIRLRAVSLQKSKFSG
jgi:hypothetical protein